MEKTGEKDPGGEPIMLCVLKGCACDLSLQVDERERERVSFRSGEERERVVSVRDDVCAFRRLKILNF